MTTLEIQRRLKALGFDPGPLDGVRGRLTIRAIKAFQASCRLAADGIAGPVTQSALGSALRQGCAGQAPDPSTAPSTGTGRKGLMPWYEEALRLKGTREAAGASDNPLILTWAKRLGLAYAHDSTAWCGLFVSHCIASALPDEPLLANPLGARRWLGFGREVAPTLGAIMVFWRGSRIGWQGHVGFYAGEDASAFMCSAATSPIRSRSPASARTGCSAPAGRSALRLPGAASQSARQANPSPPTKHEER